MSEIDDSRWVTRMGWPDIPHLDEKSKKDLIRSTPPYLRRARMKGEPALGVGRIYTKDIDEVIVKDPFPIPASWPKVYGLDIGWNVTAAVWTAWDRDSDTIYVYSEYRQLKAPPHTHAEAIKKRGAWMNGMIDPASRQRNQADGTRMIDNYRLAGLNVFEADNAVESGIMLIHDLLATGRLRFWPSLPMLEFEYNMYHRDDKGKVVKENDHLLDALRYAVSSGGPYARIERETEMGGNWVQTQVADTVAGY